MASLSNQSFSLNELTKKFPADLIPRTSCKSIVKKFSKELTNEKVTFSDIFLLFLGVLL